MAIWKTIRTAVSRLFRIRRQEDKIENTGRADREEITLAEDVIRQIHEYENAIERISRLTGADSDMVKIKVDAYATEHGMTQFAAASKIAQALEAYSHMREVVESAYEEIMDKLTPAFRQLGMQFREAMNTLSETMNALAEAMREAQETQRRREEIRAWRRYYKERAKMTNNYRRVHGLPMIRRPRRRGGRRSKPPDGSGSRTKRY